MNLILAMLALTTLLLAVVYASFFEWVLHKYIMHRPVGWFRYPFEAHALTHHKLFQADNTYHLSKRDHSYDSKIPMAWWNGPILILIGMILLPGPISLTVYLLSYAEIAITICIVSLLTFGGYYGTYEYLHWCMHCPRKRWFEKSAVYKWMNAHHVLHHKYVGHNFNVVVPIADWVLGTLLTRAKRPFDQVRGSSVPDVQP